MRTRTGSGPEVAEEAARVRSAPVRPRASVGPAGRVQEDRSWQYPSRDAPWREVSRPEPDDRPCHEAMPQEKVIGILRQESGTKIDLGCVAILEDLAARDAL